MFQLGDLVVYHTTGVCRVEAVTTPNMSGADRNKLYYQLKPLQQDGVIYCPVDNPKVRIRPVISREEALANFIADHEGDDAFTGVDASDLRHRFVVTLEDNTLIEQTGQQLKAVSGVADIRAEYELAEGFSTLQQILQIASIAVISVLLVVSLLIISNTVKLAMYDRKDEIAIMKMVGATNGFIRLPFVVEGFTLGMLGAALAFGLEWVMYDAAVLKISEVDALQLFKFVPFEVLLIPMVATFAATGMFVGIVGSWTAIRKFLNV